MVKKKRSKRKPATRRGKSTPRSKTAAKKPAVRRSVAKKTAARRKPVKKAAGNRKPAKTTSSRRRAPARASSRPIGKATRKSTPPRKMAAASRNRLRGQADSAVVEDLDPRGLGAEAGGQSGDTEGLSRAELADSESVEELVEEGQAFEAGIVSGVENAPPAGRRGVRTRQVPEDDVPQEYLDED